jgi:hypothetical protein
MKAKMDRALRKTEARRRDVIVLQTGLMQALYDAYEDISTHKVRYCCSVRQACS